MNRYQLAQKTQADGPRLPVAPADVAEWRGAAMAGARVANLAEQPLIWLVRRKLITARQFEAAELLAADYERAQLGPRVTMSWENTPIQRGARRPADTSGPGEAALKARARFEAALAAAGRDLADILWRIVCAGEGLVHAERALGWPHRSAKLVLGFALDRVADHYRLR